MKNNFIPISDPVLGEPEKKLLNQAIDSGWISSKGPFVSRFENNFSKFIGTKFAVAINSGTAAIHLALASLKIGYGDEVILPALTMIATALPVVYCRATPVLVDVEKDTGNIDPEKIEEKITKKTRAIIVVHLHGHPADMKPIIDLAKKYHLSLIEDAAESHGALYQGKETGSLGDIGCFSFYANKIITTGEGGMTVTNNQSYFKRIKSLQNLARSGGGHFLHREIAYAYRMGNLQGAVGVAQLYRINGFIKRKRRIAAIYTKLLKDVPYLELPVEKPYARSVFWHYAIVIKKNSPISRNQLEKILSKKNIETRRFFIPMHEQPALKKIGLFKNERYPIAESLAKNGLCLPSGLTLKDEDIYLIAEIVKRSFAK